MADGEDASRLTEPLRAVAEFAAVFATLGIAAQVGAVLTVDAFYDEYGVNPSDVGIDPVRALSLVGAPFLLILVVSWVVLVWLMLLYNRLKRLELRPGVAPTVYPLLRQRPFLAPFILVLVPPLIVGVLGGFAGERSALGLGPTVLNPISLGLNVRVGSVRWFKVEDRPHLSGVGQDWHERQAQLLGAANGLSYIWDIQTRQVVVFPSTQAQFVVEPRAPR